MRVMKRVMNPSASQQVPVALPAGVTVLERGWLSSNNIVIHGPEGSALIDSGYCTHAPQTLALVQAALAGQPLDLLLNTHLHSDHCGGNAALQAAYPQVRTLIAPGMAHAVHAWDPDALSYGPTGQSCPPFRCDGVLQPGQTIMLGHTQWQIHAAPGHDPHSVMLFEPASGVLVSADALWERGFGVVFPELDGAHAFDDVAATLDVIESLRPRAIIPGHGAPFTAVAPALAYARARLEGFAANPSKHLQYAAKVLLKFKLLEVQHIAMGDLQRWAQHTPYLRQLLAQHFAEASWEQGLDALVQDLVRANAATRDGTQVHNV